MKTLLLLFATCAGFCCAQGLGPFEDHTDVGTVLHPGTVEYDATHGAFSITGSGDNMWAKEDDFQFVWKKVSGDIAIAADIAFPTQGGNAHRKGVLMIRQNLNADSAYVDAALHGDGLTSLQSRDTNGGNTREVGTNAASPHRLRLEKRGDYFYLFLAKEGEPLRLAGGSMRLTLAGPFYVGLGVCAHNKDATEKVVFSKIELGAVPGGKLQLYSTLETVSVASTDRRVAYVTKGRLTSPSWSTDGKSLQFRQDGALQQIPVQGGQPAAAQRTPGMNREESVYYVSNRSGSMQIWRVNQDGSGDEQVVNDEYCNFHPHLSPDGKRLAMLSYDKSLKGPVEDQDVTLRMLDLADKKVKVVAKLVGGEGTIDAPAWSPDSKQLTFVSFQYLP